MEHTEMINRLKMQQGENLLTHINDTLNIDYDKNIIYITSVDEMREYAKLNGMHMMATNDALAFTSWLSWCAFGGNDWYLYVDVEGFSKKERYDADGVLIQSVDNAGQWFDLTETNEDLVCSQGYNNN